MIAPLSERREHQERWLESLSAGQFRQLFEHLPGTLFFAKDRESRLMLGNPAFIARCGLSSLALVMPDHSSSVASIEHHAGAVDNTFEYHEDQTGAVTCAADYRADPPAATVSITCNAGGETSSIEFATFLSVKMGRYAHIFFGTFVWVLQRFSRPS